MGGWGLFCGYSITVAMADNAEAGNGSDKE